MKKYILIALALAMPTLQFAMGRGGKALSPSQEVKIQRDLDEKLKQISSAQTEAQIANLQNQSISLINSVPGGLPQYSKKLDRAIAEGQDNVIRSEITRQLAAIKVERSGVKTGIVKGQQEVIETRARLKAVNNFAKEQRTLVATFATRDTFQRPGMIWGNTPINFNTAVRESRFDNNADNFDALTNALRASIVEVLINKGLKPLNEGYIEKNQAELQNEINNARNTLLAYRNTLINTYVQPLVGNNNSIASNFRKDILNLTKELMKHALKNHLITQGDMTSFENTYNKMK